MLKVGIHDHYAVAMGMVEACQHGCLLSEIARQGYVAKTLVAQVHLLNLLQRMVLAAVVYQQYLPEIAVLLLQNG